MRNAVRCLKLERIVRINFITWLFRRTLYYNMIYLMSGNVCLIYFNWKNREAKNKTKRSYEMNISILQLITALLSATS